MKGNKLLMLIIGIVVLVYGALLFVDGIREIFSLGLQGVYHVIIAVLIVLVALDFVGRRI